MGTNTVASGVLPTRRSQADRSSRTRRQILDAAVAVIDESGYAQASLAAIGARSGVSIGAVQHHFGSRDQLILAVLTDLRDQLVAGSDAPISRPETVPERLRATLDHYWAVLSTSHYRAVMQIQLGTGGDSCFSRQVTGVLQASEAALDDIWISAFHDLDRTRLADARRVALATLRGIAVRRMHSERDPQWSDQREMLLRMIRSELGV